MESDRKSSKDASPDSIADAKSQSRESSEKRSKEKPSSEKSLRHCLCDSKDYSTFMICCDKCSVWYHGDCVQVTRTMSKKIEKYFCTYCISKDNSLGIVYKVVKKESTPRIEERKESVERKEKPTTISVKPESIRSSTPPIISNEDRCGNCVGCMWLEDCKKCTNCVINVQPCLRRACVMAGQLAKKRKLEKQSKKVEESKASFNAAVKSIKRTKVETQEEKRNSSTKKEINVSTINNTVAKIYNGYCKSKRVQVIPHFNVAEEDRQCWGPGCCKSARPATKYCSDDCGMALAELRLKTILPDRINAFYRETPLTEVQDNEQICTLLKSKNNLEEELKRLDECCENVNNWISTLSNAQPSSSDTNSSVDDGSFVVFCPVCAMEFSMMNYGRHMQRCFVRIEKQSTFGTSHSLPQNPRSLVCDAFNKVDKTFCKRLRVACSEHYKDGSEEDIKVCGAPLIWFDGSKVVFKSLFVEPEQLSEHLFCMEKRKHCNVHHNWAQNSLGLIDNERYNILLKQDEINEKLRQLKQKRVTRGDVISLLCNQTIAEFGVKSEYNSTEIENPVKQEDSVEA